MMRWTIHADEIPADSGFVRQIGIVHSTAIDPEEWQSRPQSGVRRLVFQ